MAKTSPSDNLDILRQIANNPGDRISVQNLRKSGRMTARERINALLDADTFVEIDAFVQHRSGDHNLHLHRPLGDGVVAGHGMLDGRRIVCFAQDYSIFEGTMGEMHAKKISKIVEFAEKSMLPVIGIWGWRWATCARGGFILRSNWRAIGCLCSMFRSYTNSLSYTRYSFWS